MTDLDPEHLRKRNSLFKGCIGKACERLINLHVNVRMLPETHYNYIQAALFHLFCFINNSLKGKCVWFLMISIFIPDIVVSLFYPRDFISG